MMYNVEVTLERKARFVAGGHQTEPTKDITFASVAVSQDRFQLAFLVAALNDLDILSADVSGAYLNAKKAAEKVYTIAGKEFGPERQGRVAIITRALYGLRNSGKAWRDHMAATLRNFGYTSCKADPDVWMMKPKLKPDGIQVLVLRVALYRWHPSYQTKGCHGVVGIPIHFEGGQCEGTRPVPWIAGQQVLH
ncbi:Reverse transcriptase (RNA-dependent DNA polymerase) [Fragilaria crotonensis]|nr:Reverse transcriptase (RNA-dependent DNA polymerase) [Fragilaria crotonensis]